MFKRVILAAGIIVAAIGTHAANAQGFDEQLRYLHVACDHGDRRACVRFGILIGEHHERVAEWRRMHPEFFWWDR